VDCTDSLTPQVSYYEVEGEVDITEKLNMNEPRNIGQAIGKILVMEEDSGVRTLIGKILTKYGYEVSSARDGIEAIELYQSAQALDRSFDIVILDLTVDFGMGGIETIQKLKEIDPDVKGIVTTGYIFDDVICNYQEYGFCGALTKPIKLHELNSLVDKLTKSR